MVDTEPVESNDAVPTEDDDPKGDDDPMQVQVQAEETTGPSATEEASNGNVVQKPDSMEPTKTPSSSTLTPYVNEIGTKRTADDADLPGGPANEEGNGSIAAKKQATEPVPTPTTPGPNALLTGVPTSTPVTTPAPAPTPAPAAPTIQTPTLSESRSSSRMKSCLVEGCEKLRAKSGYCLRHFKDKSAPIRSGTPEYERRICVIEGCERLRSKGEHCHRHHKDPNAPIRNKSDKATDRKKKCGIENCDRLQVKGGFCSRHFRNRGAPVLTTPAFSFDADARWNELFPQLEAFYKKNGHSRVPTSQKTDLARFVVHIRCVYRTKKQKMLKADQAAAASEGPDDNGNDNDNGNGSVSGSVSGNGNGNGNDSTPVDENHPDLTKSKLLTPERMEALKTINFEFQLWTVEPSQWEQRFQELLAYRTEHGHFHVTNKQNATLSSWCKTQRQRYKNTMAIYQGLYGVELTCPQKKARELYEKAKEKVKEAREAAGDADGNTVKAAAMSTPNLTDIGEAKNMMDPERICKLNAVGFEWELQKDTYVESWENRYNQLLKFKVINGHCRVPKSSGDNPQLGQWVKQMRKYHGWKEDGKPFPSTFTEERIARLNELGFEWRLKDTPMKSVTPKPEDEANTPVIAARILNSQLGNAVDVTPLPQYQQQGAAAAAAAAASLPINTGNGASVNGAAGENGQNMNWGWGNNGFDGTGNSATV